jgi:hypothetical protein
MRHRLLAVFALFGASLGPEVDASQDVQSPEFQAALKERVTLLSARPEPEAWLLAAWLAGNWCKDPAVCGDGQVRLLTDKLLSKPPVDPGVLRTLIDLLPRVLKDRPDDIAGERQRLVLELQKLDPDHLRSWLMALPDPGNEANRREAEQILARAARSTRIESDYTPTFRWLRKHLATLPPIPTSAEEEAMLAEEGLSAVDMEAMALVHAMNITDSLRLFRWCELADSSLQADCRAIGQRLMTRGDSYYDRAVGVSLFEKVARTDAEREIALNARARLNWLMKAAAACPGRSNPIVIAAYMEKDGTEIETMEATLLARGLPLDPPADPPKEIGCEMVPEPN